MLRASKYQLMYLYSSLLCMRKAPTLTSPVQQWPVAEFQAK